MRMGGTGMTGIVDNHGQYYQGHVEVVGGMTGHCKRRILLIAEADGRKVEDECFLVVAIDGARWRSGYRYRWRWRRMKLMYPRSEAWMKVQLSQYACHVWCGNTINRRPGNADSGYGSS